jgi:Gpi18-like mannosyltransferase
MSSRPATAAHSSDPSFGVAPPVKTTDAVAPLRPQADGPVRGATRFRRYRSALLLTAIVTCGIGIRAWLVYTPGLGDSSDVSLFARWMRAVTVSGVGQFHHQNGSCDYPPLMLYVWWAMGRMALLLGLDLNSDVTLHRLLKLPACAADLFIAIALYVEGRRLVGSKRAVGACALWFLNPVSIYNSAFWGQVDALHSGLVLVGLILLNRGRWCWGGALAALALLQKLQSAAIVPLLVFETYRLGRRRALAGALGAAAIVAGAVLTPFAINGTLTQAVVSAYSRVVGQYPELSRNAFNVWYLLGDPGSYDSGPPPALVQLAAQGADQIGERHSLLLFLSWRRLALAAYALCAAVILSLYSLRPDADGRFLAAGLLGLAFFLIPTEIHERYALPALAVLPLWAVRSAWRERAYCLLSALLLLNLAQVLPPESAGVHLAGAALAVFVGLLLAAASATVVDTAATATDRPAPAQSVHREPRALGFFLWFRRATIVALLGCGAGAGWIAMAAARSPPPFAQAHTLYLSTLTPAKAVQGWRRPAVDRTVSGGVLHLGEVYFLRGVGTHAPAEITYAIPPGYDRFRATVGIDRATAGRGSVIALVELDGVEGYRSPVLTGETPPVDVDLPLAGSRKLTLRAATTADGKKSDHLDWALARLVRGDSPELP